jgi:hypothetical protein
MKNIEEQTNEPFLQLLDLCDDYMKQYPDEQDIYGMIVSAVGMVKAIEILTNRNGKKIIFKDDADKIDYLSWEYE